MTLTPSPSTGASSTEPTGGTALPALLVSLVALILYLPTLGHELVYDDWFLIDPGQNASMQGVNDDFGVALNLFTEEYWEGVNPSGVEELKNRGQALYRPLTTFIWGTLSFLFKYENATQAVPYHLANLLANVWVVYLLFQVIVRLFGSVRLAVLGSLLFALHPLHSEAVAYVAGLSDLISTVAVLLGLLFWLRATDNPAKLKLGPYVGLLATMFIGLLGKEGAVLVLAVVGLTDVMLTLRGRVTSMSQRIATYGGMLAVMAANIALRFAVIGYIKPSSNAIGTLDNVLINVDTGVRVANAFKLLAKYVWLVLWPKDLSVDYSKSVIDVSPGWASPGPLAGIILITVMVLLGLAKLRSSPAFGWGLLFFVGCATFVSNMFVPIGTVMAERLMYLPSIGLCLAAATILNRLLAPSETASGAKAGAGGGLNPVGLLLCVLILGGAGMRTYSRNADFHDPITLFEAAEQVVPESARVHFQLGTLYYNLGRFNAAVTQLETSLQYDPNFVRAAIQLGDVHSGDQNWERAIETYGLILKSVDGVDADPGDLAALQDMVLTKRAEAHRRSGNLEAALADVQRAVGLSSAGSVADRQLVSMLQGQQRWEDSIPVIRNALALAPDDSQMLFDLCRAAANTGDQELYNDSLAQLKETPDGRALGLVMEAVTLYAQALTNKNEALRAKAMDKFEQAIELDDSMATPYAFRGRYMAERSQFLHDAVTEYDRALERDPLHHMALGLKATALTQLGEFEAALDTLAILETVNPNPDLLILKAEAYFGLGELQELEEIRDQLRELGRDPIELLLNTAITYDAQGDTERALDLINQAFVDPEAAQNPEVWRHLGVLSLNAKKFEEALAAFVQQEATTLTNIELQGPFPYIPLNKAKSFLGLQRDVEAAAELERAEAILQGLDQQGPLWRLLRADILLTRADLFMAPGSLLFDAEQAELLCQEGMEHTNNQYPPFHDRSIEALLRADNTAEALARATAAQERFFKLDRFPVVVEALELAAAGDKAGAIARLKQGEDEEQTDRTDALARLADVLGG